MNVLIYKLMCGLNIGLLLEKYALYNTQFLLNIVIGSKKTFSFHLLSFVRRLLNQKPL